MNYFERAKKFRAKKRLGQNFLIDEKAVETILDDVDYVEYKNYRFLFDKLVELYSHDDLLDILNNKTKLDYDRVTNFMSKLIK